jgi:lysophospholipase L1-like esterase
MSKANRSMRAAIVRMKLTIAALLLLAGAEGETGIDAPSVAFTSGNILLRGSLHNSRVVFEKQSKGHVAFMGGSITEMDGYRPMVADLLTKRFPKATFTFTDAGIASTCSTTGAFRLETDVLEKGPVDLLFVEFAVNDDQDAGHTETDCIRGMEGILRHARRYNPYMDIVIVYFVNPGMLETLREGKTPLPIAAHERVAKHYDLSAIHLAKEVAERIAGGSLTWEEYGGTHPARQGNSLCAEMIGRMLDSAWAQPLPEDAAKEAHRMPEQPLDSFSYFSGRFVDPADAIIKNGWKLHAPEWKSLKGVCRTRFLGIPMLCAEEPGAELTLAFTGSAIGAYVLAGPDAGIVEASVDGGPVKQVDLLHRYSENLHYPRTVMFAAELKPGDHTLALRMSDKTSSLGHALRIIEFVAN